MSKKSIQQQLIESVLDDSDDAGFMAKSNLYDAIKNAIQLHRIIKDTDNLEPWVLEKLALAADYIDTVKDYLEYRNIHNNEFTLSGEYAPGHGHHEYEESALSESYDQSYFVVADIGDGKKTFKVGGQDEEDARKKFSSRFPGSKIFSVVLNTFENVNEAGEQQDPTQNQAVPAQQPAPAPQDGALAVEPAVPSPAEADLGKILDGIKAIQKYAKSRDDLDPEFDKDKLVKLVSKKIQGTKPEDAEKIANFILDTVTESSVMEKAKSKAQQRFMGMVHAAQKGEKPASKEVAKVAKDMPKKAAKDYAATKHKGLPDKVEEGSNKIPKKLSPLYKKIIAWARKRLEQLHGTMEPEDAYEQVAAELKWPVERLYGMLEHPDAAKIKEAVSVSRKSNTALMDEWNQYKLATTRSTSNESVNADALARVAKMFAGKK